jgi:serine/threonine-protein kinase
VLRSVETRDPTPPSAVDPRVPRDLETVCLKALAREPERRFRSALELHDDLRRFLAGEQVRARPESTPARMRRWLRRHPVEAGLGAAAVVLVAMLALASLLFRRELMETNVYAARGVADSMLLQLQTWAEPIVAASERNDLRALTAARSIGGLRALFAAGVLAPGAEAPFESITLNDEAGLQIARAPENRDLVGMDFSARDYVRGALANAGRTGLAAVHVSRVYPSKGDGILKFAITVPVYGPDGPGAPPVGVLGGSVAADATMGLPRLHDARRKVVLVGRWDPNRAPDDRVPFAREPEHLVLLHPAFRHAEPVMEISHPLLLLFTRSEGAELRAASADAPSGADDFYFDPVRRRYPGYAGPWLAGFAPVGNTDLVIIVQTRDWAAVALFAAAAALLAALAALGAVRVFRRIPPT